MLTNLVITFTFFVTCLLCALYSSTVSYLVLLNDKYMCVLQGRETLMEATLLSTRETGELADSSSYHSH